MTFLPDSWALGQDFVVLPLNLEQNKKVKVKLGGITCDPDDTYYKQEKDNFLMLPEVKEGEKLYVGVFGAGAYQEMIAGVGGVHHCLMPEGAKLIIRKKENKFIFNYANEVQSAKDVLDTLDYKNTHNLIQYIDKYDLRILDYEGPLAKYYEKLKEDFPSVEIFPYENVEQARDNKKYKIFLLSNEDIIVGSAFVAILEKSNFAVLNYLTIFKEHRNKGYGHIFINELKNYFSTYYGLMVEIEIPENADTTNHKNRRVKFYEDLDFNTQDFDYQIKNVGKEGYLPMHLIVCNLKNKSDYEYKYSEMKEILDEYYSTLFGNDFENQYTLKPTNKEKITSLG